MERCTTDAATAQPVRVVLLLDSFNQPRWVAETIQDMMASATVDLVGVVLNLHASASNAAPRRNLAARLVNAWKKRDAIALEAYLRFDERRYPAPGPSPFEPTDVTTLLAGLPVIEARPLQTVFSDFLDEPCLMQVADLEPDVAVQYGFRTLRGRALSIPKYGVWSLHHGDNGVNRGGPPGLWEVFGGWRSTGAILQRLSEELDGGATLMRTQVPTNPISVHQNRVTMYRAAAPLLIRKLKQLQRIGPQALDSPSHEPAFLPYSKRLFVNPTLRELARGLRTITSRLLHRKRADRRIREQWQLAYASDSSQHEGNCVPQTSFFRFTPLVPPADRFWADPFPVRHQGRSFVFFEELVYTENKGRIAVMEMKANGPLAAPAVVLDMPYHLSYPFMLLHDGEWYMTPEMVEAGRQEIFRAKEFPLIWEICATIELGSPIVDPTLHHEDGTWWLFAGTRASPFSDFNELSIYHSDSPFGPWTAHPMNPVMSDARSARPAGRLFRVGSDLIRPAQDGTPDYGTAIAFKRISRLDREGYSEEPYARADPHWSPELTGTHSINAAGSLTMIDVRKRVRR